MRSPRALSLVMITGLIATAACGARLPAKLQQQAQNQVLNPGSGSSATGGGGLPQSGGSQALPGQPQTGPTSGSGPGSVPTSGTSGNGGKTGTTTTTQQTSSAQGSPKCGTGTDVGLTSSTIDLGTIADVSGPVSGLFQGAIEGMQAFANFVNSTQGGICGHQVKVDFRDGGTNCTQTENAASSLVNKVFAFVGSFALYDNCAATVLKRNPNVPDVHDSLDVSAGQLPNHFDIEPGQLGYATGMFQFYKQKYGSKVLHVGTISENIPSATQKQNAIVHAAEAAGWKFVYQQAEQPTNSNFQQDFVTACSRDHIQIFFTVTEDAQNAAAMIQNENQAGCRGLINIIPIAYDQAFLQAFKGNTSAINGLQGYNEYAMFFNSQDAAGIPELKLFQDWFARTNGGQPANLYAMFAWASGRLFEQAMENAGPKISRQTVLAALKKVKNYTSNGMIAPETPSSKTEGVHCYVLWQFVNGQFTRQSDPPINGPTGGFRCDGRFLPY
jgi:ABC-type branched-subunit amino acid transport system substrate-binding protein